MLRAALPLVQRMIRMLAFDTDCWFDKHWLLDSPRPVRNLATHEPTQRPRRMHPPGIDGAHGMRRPPCGRRSLVVRHLADAGIGPVGVGCEPDHGSQR
jgi:hypothetical protein